jgi:hypothetical protein
MVTSSIEARDIETPNEGKTRLAISTLKFDEGWCQLIA